MTPDDTDTDAATRSRHLKELAHADEKRLEAIQRISGTLSGTFPPEYLDDIRQDWPD